MRTPASPVLTIEHALLGFFLAGPTHGYAIYGLMLAPGGLWQVWRLKQSHLYALLAKLEENGYLAAGVQQQEAAPPRKVYSLTVAGRAAFDAWLRCPVARGRQMRIEFLAKFYFVCRQDPAVADQLLAQQMATCAGWLAELQQQAPTPQQDLYAFAVQQFRINQVESFLAWLLVCRQALALPVADS